MEKRGNMRNSKAVAEMIICDQEFRRAIQAMPVRELELPLWDTAKAEGRVLQQVKRPPRDRMELERYLRIADDFAESQRYETLDLTTLHCLAAGVIPWAWDQVAHGELLVLSNTIGIYFPHAKEVHTAVSSASSRAVPATIGRQPIQRWEPVQSRGKQNVKERPRIGTWRICGRRGGGTATNRPVGRQPIQKATTVTTSPGRQSSSPRSCTRTSSPMEKSEKTEGTEKTEGPEETEESEDLYYIPDDYYSEESGYDSDMFKKCWEDDF
jgi:hypothetical protein